MTTEDLEKWLNVKGKEDVWWVQINGKTLGQKVTLEKIEEISVRSPSSEVSVLHISQQTIRPRPWVEVDSHKPTPSPTKTVSGQAFDSPQTQRPTSFPRTRGSDQNPRHSTSPTPPNSSHSEKSEKTSSGKDTKTLAIEVLNEQIKKSLLISGGVIIGMVVLSNIIPSSSGGRFGRVLSKALTGGLLAAILIPLIHAAKLFFLRREVEKNWDE